MESNTSSIVKRFFLKTGAILAIVMHPCFLFFYIFLFFQFNLIFSLREIHFYPMLLIVFGLTVLFPALFPLVYAGDPFLKERRKRPLTLLFTFACYLGCWLWLRNMYYHLDFYQGESVFSRPMEESSMVIQTAMRLLLNALAILSLGLLLLFLVSFRFKISLHAAGAGFLIAFCIKLLMNTNPVFGSVLYPTIPYSFILNYDFEFAWIVLILAIILSALLLWQRVASGSHTIREVVTGFSSGFIFTAIVYGFLFFQMGIIMV